MQDTIDNVRDVTDHAMKMAFFCGIPRETADITKQATEGSVVSHTRPCSVVNQDSRGNSTLFQSQT